jgi:Tol biopolymer transport system component
VHRDKMLGRFAMRRVAATGLLLAFISSIAFVALWIGNPQASSGTGKVVFAGGANILAVNVDGTGLRRLAPVGSDPSVSPDGTRIAFVGYPLDGRSDVNVMNADGTSQRRVGDAAGWSPVWSPDGTRIAYAGEPGRDDGSIYVVNADGTAARRVAEDAGLFGFAWSPDGKQIAYGVEDGIALVQVDGGGQRVIPTGSKSPWRLAWSPDGTRIAFLDLNGPLYVTNIDGGGRDEAHRGGRPADARLVAGREKGPLCPRQPDLRDQLGRERRAAAHTPRLGRVL